MEGVKRITGKQGKAGKITPHLGLGLSIVRTIVEHHRGTVRAGNMAGDAKMVCFIITLP